LENEARYIWHKPHKNPTPTNKGWICKAFYMRIKALYKESGKADQAKKEGKETQNGQKPKRQMPEGKRGKRRNEF
jgi:hypothetical protein